MKDFDKNDAQKGLCNFGPEFSQKTFYDCNGTANIRHQCRKIAVLSCHRFLINSGVEKMNNI